MTGRFQKENGVGTDPAPGREPITTRTIRTAQTAPAADCDPDRNGDRDDDRNDDSNIQSNNQSNNDFRRGHRLPDAAAFSRVFKQARRSRDNFFVVLYTSNGGREPRLGLAVAKKHCRRASGRNRVKRVVRESFRMHKGALGGLDVVVMNTPSTHRADNKALFDSLDRHWQRCRSSPTGKNKAGQEAR